MVAPIGNTRGGDGGKMRQTRLRLYIWLLAEGSVSVDAAYRAMPTHHTPTEFDAKGSSGQSAWAGVMPDAAAPPPSPAYRASGWPGWSKK